MATISVTHMGRTKDVDESFNKLVDGSVIAMSGAEQTARTAEVEADLTQQIEDEIAAETHDALHVVSQAQDTGDATGTSQDELIRGLFLILMDVVIDMAPQSPNNDAEALQYLKDKWDARHP